MADPWMKFYTTDWRSDPRLRMCSMAARGLWLEMICLMHEATPYGQLLINGRCPTDAQLAVLVGASPDEITALLGELEAAGVFSRTKEGVIYSRKLTRMAKKATIAKKNGRKGGNPKLCNERRNQPSDNLTDNRHHKPQIPDTRYKDTISSSLRSEDMGADAPAIRSEPPPKPEPTPDPEKLMFDTGVALLTSAGVSERNARSLLGRWRKSHGSEAVIAALGKAQREAAVDPVAFIQGCFRHRKREGPAPDSVRIRDGQREVYEPAIGAWVPMVE